MSFHSQDLLSSPISKSPPSYNQDPIPSNDLPKLFLISHAHSPPLNPPPQLRFDLRNLPNPPKRIRDSHVGTSKRLQEWMENDPAFLGKRDEIREEILEAMNQMIAENEKKEVMKIDPEDVPNEVNVKPFSGFDQEEPVVNGNSNEEEEDLGYRRVYMEQDFSGLELRVGIVCAIGRHRSVAMAEELARMPWDGWDVEVEHRDIAKKRGSIAGKTGGKGSHRSRGSFASYSKNDDSE